MEGEIVVTLTGMDRSGAAVAGAAERLVVPGGIPGERVRVRRVRPLGRATLAEIVAVEEASPNRVAPRCRHAGRCGGCAWQHVAYPEQLRRKTARPRRAAAPCDGRPGAARPADDRHVAGLGRHAVALPAEGGLRLRRLARGPRHGPLRPGHERRRAGRGVPRARRARQPRRLRPPGRARLGRRRRGGASARTASSATSSCARPATGRRRSRCSSRRATIPPSSEPLRAVLAGDGAAGRPRPEPPRPAGAVPRRARVEADRRARPRPGGGDRAGLPRVPVVLLPDERRSGADARPPGRGGDAGGARPARPRPLQRRRALRPAPRPARPRGHRRRGEPEGGAGRRAQPPPERRRPRTG